uniref:Cross-pathway control protein 1 n=1 Tax=Ganoderma boninense TaxID=34458 RepID=A0A5K1JV26_9APHY|nr:Cross-pathway control protein 1 [Ganoderma boninense]
MPGLIQRYNAVGEYSALISTKPSSPKRRDRENQYALPLPPSSPPRSPRMTIHEEVIEWYEAFAPPLEDLQAVIQRLQADPDLTQDRVFAHLCPAALLCALFAIALVAVREDSVVHRMLDASSPDPCWAALARFAVLAVCGVMFSVVVLKCIVYCVAEACALIVAMKTRAQMRAREDWGVPTSGLVLGGMMF